MESNIQKWAKTLFDTIKHINDEGEEFWYARELGEALEYSGWENFKKVVTKAKISVAETGQPVEYHFHDIMKMVPLGSGSKRAIDDVILTRYACYIIAQNGNAAKKPAIAGAQAYFALQTRKHELIEQREYDIERLIARQKFTDSDKRISEAVMEKGVSGRGLGEVKSDGDKVLFGGKSTSEMKKIYSVPQKKPLANRMPNVVLAAKTLANEMTAENLSRYPIDGFDEIKLENNNNNSEVRDALTRSGIVPEDLPPAEDTDKIRRRLETDDKKKAIEG